MNKKIFWTGSIVAILAIIAIILSIISLVKINTSKVQNYATYEQSDHTIVFCNSKIWESDFSGFSLYFANNKHYPEDKEWKGTYPNDYFN